MMNWEYMTDRNIYNKEEILTFAQNNKYARLHKNGVVYRSELYGEYEIIGRDFEEMCDKFGVSDLAGISLDKDIIGDGKLYSKDTCILCSVSENSKERNNRDTYVYNPNNIEEMKGGDAK